MSAVKTAQTQLVLSRLGSELNTEDALESVL